MTIEYNGLLVPTLKPLGETNSLFRAAEVAACMQGSTVVDPPRLWVGLGWQGVVRACPARRRARDGLRRRFFYARTHEPDDDGPDDDVQPCKRSRRGL